MEQKSGHDRTREDVKRLDDCFKRGIAFSLGLHTVLLLGTFTMPGLFPSMGGDLWGFPDGGINGISVGIATDVGGIPLPRPDVVSEAAAANESAGFFEDEASEPPPSDATQQIATELEMIPVSPTPIEASPPPSLLDPEPPESESNTPTVPPTPAPTRPTLVDEGPPDRPDNAVPFGQGGQVAIPTGQPGLGDGTGILTGDGVFGDRYGTYVESIRKRISDEWLQGRIDARIRSAPRVWVAFNIERNGEISGFQIVESSGNRQVDRSANRAVVAANPLAPLPRDYRGARVSVRFWFELKR